MAKISLELIQAIRNTARKMNEHPDYQWGHMGACNCGFLAQEVTRLTKAEIHRSAMTGHGDWSEQLNDYCPTSGLPMDHVITQLFEFGFDTEDLKHLERLSDPSVLAMFPFADRNLRHNVNRDAVQYLLAWAQSLEDSLLKSLPIPEMTMSKAEVEA